MSSLAQESRFRQPAVKRLGFEDGWWHFQSHFLNLGFPTLLVDECLLPASYLREFKSFGDHPPANPWPRVALRVEVIENAVWLYDAAKNFIAYHYFRSADIALGQYGGAGLFVGNSHQVELGWSFLWRCRVGLTVAHQSHPE